MSNLVDRQSARKLQQDRATFTSRKLDCINAILAHRSLTAVEKNVAIVIVQHINQGTLKAWPSIKRIADKAGGINERTVKRAVKRLCGAGVLERRRIPAKATNGWSSNIYRFKNLNTSSSFTFSSLAKPSCSGVPSKVLRGQPCPQLGQPCPKLDDEFVVSDDDDYGDLPHFAAALRKAGAA